MENTKTETPDKKNEKTLKEFLKKLSKNTNRKVVCSSCSACG